MNNAKRRNAQAIAGPEGEAPSSARPRITPLRSSDRAPKPRVKGKPERPTAGRGLITFEKLVTAAGEVLADTGFEKLTSNAICARAGVTPPAFYHYFVDKYEVLEELADRLLRKQNDAFGVWISSCVDNPQGFTSLEAIERWFVMVADFVVKEPGGIWTVRALRALPNLSHVRLNWKRHYADQIFEVARRLAPQADQTLLWGRIRIMVEFSYVVDEMVFEEDRIARDLLIREAARFIHTILKSTLEP